MSNEMNWMRRKFLQVSSLLGAGFLLGDTVIFVLAVAAAILRAMSA